MHHLLRQVRSRRRGLVDDTPDAALLQSLQVIVADDGGRLVPTLAGLLVLGRHPQHFLPQLGTTVLVVAPPPTADQSVRERERSTSVHLVEGRVEVMVERTVSLLAAEGVGADARPPGRPAGVGVSAVREALVNALVHRDYSPLARATPVQVEVHEHGVSVRSPGGLFGTVTEEDLRPGGSCAARNRRLADLLSHVGDGRVHPFASGSGRGIRTLLDASRRAGGGPPRFEVSLRSVTVALPASGVPALDPDAGHSDRAASYAQTAGPEAAVLAVRGDHPVAGRPWVPLTERTSAVRLLLEEHVELSAKQLAALLGTSERSVLVYLGAMLDVGEVWPTAPARSPHRRYRLTAAAAGPDGPGGAERS